MALLAAESIVVNLRFNILFDFRSWSGYSVALYHAYAIAIDGRTHNRPTSHSSPAPSQRYKKGTLRFSVILIVNIMEQFII